MKVYFDNAATTYPKPESVADAVYDYIKNNGANIGRGIYKSALSAAERYMKQESLLQSCLMPKIPIMLYLRQM